MLHQIKLLQSRIQPLQTQKQHVFHPLNISATSIPKQCTKFSRRHLTLFTNSSMLLLLTSQTTLDPYLVLRARAEENPRVVEPENVSPEAQTEGSSLESELQNNGQLEDGTRATPLKVEEAETNASPQETEPESKKNQQEIEVENSENMTETEPESKESPQGIEAEDTENPTETEAPSKENQQEIRAEYDESEGETSPKSTYAENNNVKVPTKRAFLDITIDGKPIGRIIIRLNEDKAPIGATRFSDLVSGRAGISFRRKEFVKIMPNYVQHGGVRSYGVDAELASKTGRSLTNERLIEEWGRLNNESQQGTKNLATTVSLIIRDPSKPPPKLKLVARQGKLVVDEEEVGVEPNGTQFTIATRDSPELDSSALVIGNVIQGMDVIEKIGQVKTVQENTTSPYFRVAKLIGDKRAVVAERGFNRPYSKVTISNCGLLP